MNHENQITGASYAAIQHHYDVSNEFYQTWLDPELVYSCALWEEGDTLDTAQIRKLDYHIQEAKAVNAAKVLDIGCGWGGLMQRMVTSHGVNEVVGLTISLEQAKWVKQKNIKNATVRLESWEEHDTPQPYDAIISIGAFEHFAKPGMSVQDREAGYRKFFEKCHSLLAQGGCLSLQTIACGNMLREDFSKFFETEIFPESDLPRISEIFNASEFLFEPIKLRNDASDYTKTVKEWKANLKRNREIAILHSSSEVVSRYEKYFNLVLISFEALKTMYLYRVTLKKIDKPRKFI